MASASTQYRWVNVVGLKLNGQSIHDALAASISVDAQTIGSNSETDSYANHFAVAVKAGATVAFRTYDVSGVVGLTDAIGDIVEAEWYVPLGGNYAGSGRQLDMKFDLSTTYQNGGMMITGITIPGEHDTETMCEVTGVLRSDGYHAPWRTTAANVTFSQT